MFYTILAIGSWYLVIGGIVYFIGHPEKKRNATRTELQKASAQSGFLSRSTAHAAQTANFIIHAARANRKKSAPLATLYASAVHDVFDPARHLFITTGAPHARGLYLRNFAWFYPTLLDPATIISEDDLRNRGEMMIKSLTMIFRTLGNDPYPTTLVPLGAKRIAAVNYPSPPSDSLLGILVGLEELLAPHHFTNPALRSIEKEIHAKADILFKKYRDDLRDHLGRMAHALIMLRVGHVTCPLFDAAVAHASATDTRQDRMRFVVNANVWSTFEKAVSLGLISKQDIHRMIGMSLPEYKERILSLFGEKGYIADTLEKNTDHPTENITLDFAHIVRGFWDFSSEKEIALFEKTADAILREPKFSDVSKRAYFVSTENPHYDTVRRLTVPSYQGRTVWPAFNVEFADRLFDLATATGKKKYAMTARKIMSQIEIYIEKNGGYPELLNEKGEIYQTWIYQSAYANSWFPRFMSVRARM